MGFTLTLTVHAARLDLIEGVEVVRGDRIGLGQVGQVLAEAREEGGDAEGANVSAASSASSRRSPGMKRRTARFANHQFGTWSRSHGLRAIQRKMRRIEADGSAVARR